MKLYFTLGFCLAMMVTCASAQLKMQEQTNASQSLVHPTTSINSFLGLLNPDNFMMRHTFSLNYLAGGGEGISLASYTNSMFYRIADPLNVRFDVTLQGSPFGQSGSFQRGDLSKVYVSRAELNYKPADNMFITLQYRQVPYGFYNGLSGMSNGFHPYSSGFWWDE
jgi:hypothetical protein